MEIINFEEAKAIIHSKEKATNHLTEVDQGVLALQRECQELVRFYEDWYDGHVVGQDENGGWIYKN